MAGEKFGRDRHQPPGRWVQTTPLLDVAGVFHHKPDALSFAKAVRNAERRGWPYGVELEPEPSNLTDANAIKVIGHAHVKPFLAAPRKREWHIGYVPREVAAELVEDLVSQDHPFCAELYGVYLGGADFVDIEFLVLVPKGSAGSTRSARRQAKTAIGPKPALTKEQQQFLKSQLLGFYRNTRLEQAEALRRVGDYAGSLDMYLRVAWLDQNGPSNAGQMDGRAVAGSRPLDVANVFIAPGILGSIAQGANSLGLDLAALHARFAECAQREVEAIRPLEPVVTVDAAWGAIKVNVLAAVMTGTRWRGSKAPV